MRVLVIFLSLVLAGLDVHAAIEGLPEPAAPREPHVVLPHEKTLANGLRVIVVERPGLPIVSATLLIKSGAEADPAGAAGLAGFTAALLTQGTETRSATQIAREIDSLGANLKAAAAWDGTVLDLNTLSANLEAAFELLADVAIHPKFAPEEIERQRRQMIDDLRVALEEPRTIVQAAAGRLLLGRGLYAHPPGGTLTSLQHLNRKDIVAFHTAHYAAAQAQLIIAGNVTDDAAFALAEKVFGQWAGKPPANAPALPAFAIAEKPRTVLIDMPKAGQAAVLVTTAAVPRNAGDYFAGLVANTILGGGYTSWLNQEIRVKRGLSYGARSSFDALNGGGICVAGCQTKNPSATEVALLVRDQLTRLGAEAASPDFFAARQSVLMGDFARDLETNRGYVTRVVELAAHAVPLSALAEYADRVRAVTPDDARKFAADHYHPADFDIVVVGRSADIAKSLRAAFPQLESISESALDLDSPTLKRASKR